MGNVVSTDRSVVGSRAAGEERVLNNNIPFDQFIHQKVEKQKKTHTHKLN